VPNLEQIIRPFVVDPTTPPVPYITTLHEEPPELVRLNIGIGRTRLRNLRVAPIIPPGPEPDVEPLATKPEIQQETLSSSYSISIQFYHDQKVREEGEAPEE
jgi:hypothetical protein